MAALSLSALTAPTATSSASPLAALLQRGLQTLFGAPSASLTELLPPFLLAVPKSKVSHSRKSMRSANKGLKEKLNIVTCPGCGRAKRAHHLCSNCYSEITRGFKTAARQSSSPSVSSSSSSTAPSASTSSLSNSTTLKTPRWAKNRGGATPVQHGEKLTKWMRAKLGYRKADPTVRLGQEHKVHPSSKYRGVGWQERRGNKRDQDDDGDDTPSSGGGNMPHGLQFA